MKATEFDSEFDSGNDVTGNLDHSKARRINQEPRRVNVDFPAWMVEALDREARRLGVAGSPSSRFGSRSVWNDHPRRKQVETEKM